jgi:predicted DNA-binding transcriptional regulator YafY
LTERTVNPHHLYNMRGDWYVFAYDQNRKDAYFIWGAARGKCWPKA